MEREESLSNEIRLFPVKIDSAELLREIYRLRYEVYCLEAKFLDAAKYFDRMESDEHDSHSTHFGVVDQDGVLVGTSRLVLDDRCYGFPMEKYCAIKSEYGDSPINSIAEISRMVVSKKYRRRADDGLTGAESYLVKEYRRRRPEIVCTLYKSMYQYSITAGIKFWFAAMEKSLWRVLEMSGIVFEQIGEEVDYWGPVCPYIINLQAAAQNLKETNPSLFQEFTRENWAPGELFKTAAS